MAGKNIAVFGIYPHRASFEYALGALKKEGFRDTDVSVLLQENLLRKPIGINTLPCLSTVTVLPKNFARARSFSLFLLREHRRFSRFSTWFQTCMG